MLHGVCLKAECAACSPRIAEGINLPANCKVVQPLNCELLGETNRLQYICLFSYFYQIRGGWKSRRCSLVSQFVTHSDSENKLRA